MKTKRIIFAAVLTVCFLISNFAIAGGGSDGPATYDSLRVAQVFGGIKIDRYEGSFGFQRDGVGDYVSAEFKMSLAGRISYLKIGDVVVVNEGDTPLEGLPVNAIGETRNFYLNLYAYANNYTVAWGMFTKNLLLADDPIIVTLSPTWRGKCIPSPDDNPNLMLRTGDGNISGYDAYNHGFWVGGSPLQPITYEIYDPVTGTVYQNGTVDFLAGKDIRSSGSIINIQLLGGVVVLPDVQQTNLDNQLLDGTVSGVPAKVYIWTLAGKSGSMDLTGLQNSQIQVFRWVSEGEMQRVAETDTGSLSVKDGYDKVVVVVAGTDSSLAFYANFYRYE